MGVLVFDLSQAAAVLVGARLPLAVPDPEASERAQEDLPRVPAGLPVTAAAGLAVTGEDTGNR